MNELRALLKRVDDIDIGVILEEVEWIKDTSAVVVRPLRGDDIITDKDHVGVHTEALANYYKELGCEVVFVEGDFGKNDSMVATIGGSEVWCLTLIGNKRVAERTAEQEAAHKRNVEKPFIPPTVEFSWTELKYKTKEVVVPNSIETRQDLEDWCNVVLEEITDKRNRKPGVEVQDGDFEWDSRI
jgi:hypothetical protein